MKINEIKAIEQVANYSIHGENILYTIGDGLRNKKLYLNNIALGFEGVGSYFFYNGNILCNLWSESHKSFIYNLKNNSTSEVLNQRIQNVISGYAIYSSGDEYIYKNQNFEGVFTSNYQFQLIQDNFGISSTNNSILKVSLSKKNLWQFFLADLGNAPFNKGADEIGQILGVINGNLWFFTNGGRLVALDIESGQPLKKYSASKEDEKNGYEISIGFGKTFFDEKSKNIICISSLNFQEVNTRTFEIHEIYNLKEADPKGIGKYENIYSPLLQYEYFTFLGEIGDQTGGIRHIGLFDYRKKELVSELEVITPEERKKGNKLIPPQPLFYSGKNLFIKDFKDNMHIFEKTQ